MLNEEVKARRPFYGVPILIAAIVICGLFFTSSLVAIIFPNSARWTPYANLGVLVLAVFMNGWAFNVLKSDAAKRSKTAHEREQLLNEALIRAESSDRTRQAIIANMTHEFRTPLNSVIGFAELLADGEMNKERAEMARCVQRSGWELLDLVNSLVKTAELSSVDFRPHEPMSFTLEEMVTAVAASHEQELKTKGLDFRVSWKGTKMLNGDMESISAILGLLVSNAVKYSDSGTIELRARELSVADGDRVSIECLVSDQGRGMEEETLNRLFRPFEQGDDPLIKRYPGVGVGLYSAKRLTESLRGDLRLESELGVGTTAYLIIPLETDIERGSGK